MPSNAADAAGLLASAIADPGPVVFVENNSLYFRREPEPADHTEPVPIGRARTRSPRRRPDDRRDVAGWSARRSQAAERLASDGIEAEVIDPRTLVPLDIDTIAASVRRTGRAVVAHEAVTTGGFGAELTAQIQEAAFDCLEAPIQRVGAPFEPVPVSPPLEDDYRPDADDIHAAARIAIEWDWPEPSRRHRASLVDLSALRRGSSSCGSVISDAPGDQLEHLAVAQHDLEVGQRDARVLAGERLGASALAALDRLDQPLVMAVGDDQDLRETPAARPRSARTR